MSILEHPNGRSTKGALQSERISYSEFPEYDDPPSGFFALLNLETAVIEAEVVAVLSEESVKF